MKGRELARAVARGLGELMTTAGVLVALFVAYQLFWTNVEAAQAQDRVTEELRSSWERTEPLPTLTQAPGAAAVPAAPPRTYATGEGVALLHVPRLGEGWNRPVVEGVDAPELSRGVGHYPETVLPGAVGNFSLAGHRTTNGEPFRDLDQMQPGDPVVVETEQGWFLYTVDAAPLIVLPSQVEVIAPTPSQPEVAPTEARMTLTTCHPRWSARQRLVVHATLVESRTRAQGPPPVLAEV